MTMPTDQQTPDANPQRIIRPAAIRLSRHKTLA